MTAPSPIAVVSGSGMDLEGVFDSVHGRVPFRDIPGLLSPGVAGHAGCFVQGRVGGLEVILQAGRIHLYEGHPPEAATRPLEVLRNWGVRRVLLLNAAGGLRSGLATGDLVALREVRAWPWLRHPVPPLTRPDFIAPGTDHEGVLAWMTGPCYETRAETEWLRRAGADVVGMSIAPELARCRELGLEAAAVSCVSNLCGAPGATTHLDVLAHTRAASEKIVRWLGKLLRDGFLQMG